MATITDVVYLLVILAVIGGSVAVILSIVNAANRVGSNTKEKLKAKGYDISPSGVSIQTNKRMNREDYLDATQRNVVKAIQASSINRGTDANSKKTHHQE
ncbi:hypothetical protein Clacol_005668 [Clathrus columnatus]|uniref:Uncharacterized protein n=1 Tax=Clathrus columnatus TaxID=1419009 RepID=A0AAV5AEW2_9AGAM|nr:hypothetical protein Clacol_005668 [Clathrus columnatus]